MLIHHLYFFEEMSIQFLYPFFHQHLENFISVLPIPLDTWYWPAAVEVAIPTLHQQRLRAEGLCPYEVPKVLLMYGHWPNNQDCLALPSSLCFQLAVILQISDVGCMSFLYYCCNKLPQT